MAAVGDKLFRSGQRPGGVLCWDWPSRLDCAGGIWRHAPGDLVGSESHGPAKIDREGGQAFRSWEGVRLNSQTVFTSVRRPSVLRHDD